MKASNEKYRQYLDLAGRENEIAEGAEPRRGPLSPEEAAELAGRFKENGDREARDRLIDANQGLVRLVAMRYRKPWEEGFEDLVQEGNVGLVEALGKFEPERGAFSFCAMYWIRARIQKRVMDDFRMVKIGATQTQRRIFSNLGKTEKELRAQGVKPDVKTLAGRLNVKESEVEEMRPRLLHPDLSLDAPRGESAESWEDVLLDDGQSVEDKVADLQLRARVQGMFDAVLEEMNDERARVILYERLFADEPRTLDSLGEEFGVSRERARQIEAKALNRMRRWIEKNMPDIVDFLDDAAVAPAASKSLVRGR